MTVQRSVALVGALAVASQAMAQFSNDSIFVVRLGDAESPAGNTTSAQKVYVDEYRISDQSLVRSIGLASSGADAFTLPGTANIDDGHLNLAGNGQFLTLGGFNAALATPNLLASSASTLHRSIAAVYADGTTDTTTKLTDAYNGTNLRAVASDGTSFWTAGGTNNAETSPTINSGGLRYVSGLGAATSTNISVRTVKPVSPANAEADSQRNVRMVDGQLFINTPAQNAYTNRGAYSLSPLTAPGTQVATPLIVNLEGSGTDLNGNTDQDSATNGKWYPKTDSIFFDLDPTVPGYDVAYGTGGKEDYHKWSLIWSETDAAYQWKRVSVGVLAAPNQLEINALSARLVGDTVQLFASLDGGIVMVEDTAGYGLPMSTPFAQPQTAGYWLDAGAGTQFRGIAAVPEPSSLTLLAAGLLVVRRRRAR